MDELFFFPGELLSFAPILQSGVASGLLMDTVLFIFVCTLIIWPPPSFTSCGLILENLPRPGNRRDLMMRGLEIKVLFNRFYLSLLPALFVLYELLVFGYPLTVLCCSGAVFILQFLHLFYIFIRLGEIKLAREFSTEELARINQYTLDSSDFIGIALSTRFLLDNRRFGYSIQRLDDLKFAAIESNRYREDDSFIMIVENTKTGDTFKDRVSSDSLSDICEFVSIEINYKNIHERFIERFTSYINGNTRFIMSNTASLDTCFACDQKQPDVIIKKSCIGDTCTGCACRRPTWCVSCLARIFAAAQPAGRPSQWMDGTAACPTCRATFCPNDVLFIVDETDL